MEIVKKLREKYKEPIIKPIKMGITTSITSRKKEKKGIEIKCNIREE